jgi:divalent metal cation (Fe/Co/Zn/Cd) transporter
MGALSAVFVILYNAWNQLKPAILEFEDAASGPGVEPRISTIAERILGVIGSDKCCARKMGLNYNAMKQLQPAILELTDRAPDANLESRVREIARGVANVIGLDKCFGRKMGFSFYVDLHIVVNGDFSVRQGHKIAHEVENKVLNELPQVAEVLVHVEPQEELIGK